MASSPATKGKSNRKFMVVAAAAALVLLPGAGFLVWKTMTPDPSQTEVAQAPKKTQTAPVTAQKTAAPQASKTKAADEPSPAPQATEAANAGGTNIGDLVTALKSKDVTERRQAASALHGLGMDAKDAIPALKEALKDSDSEVQMWAALALVNTQAYDKGVIPVLVRSLKNDNAVLRQVACLSLGLIPYQEGDKTTVVPALTDIAGKDPSQDVRQAAKSALNIIGAESGGAEGIGK